MPSEKSPEQSEQTSRRGFMSKAIGGFSIGAVLGQEQAQAAKRKRRSNPSQQQENQQNNIEGQTYNTGRLEGRVLADLYTAYTGISGKVPAKVSIDFHRQLKSMWVRKEKRSGQNSVVKKTSELLQKSYVEQAPTRMNLKEYLNWVDGILSEVKRSMNWELLGQIKGLSTQERKLVKEIAKSIDGRDLIAYGLTELMPSRDGKLNYLVLDFLLKNAGLEYVDRIPAMYDPKTSFGLFQFTEYALYDVPGKPKRGASIINQALPEEQKIPGSVSKLRGAQHYKAAFLFMIENIANLANRRYNSLNSTWQNNKNDLVMFTATAHHMPVPALGAARRWLDNNARLAFYISCGRHLRKYALKTKANLEALQNID